MSSFEFIHKRRLAELEYELRLKEIDLEQHQKTYTSVDKPLITELMEAKMKLALFRVQDYAITHHLNCSRTPSPLMTQSVLAQPFCSVSPQ
jgi:hypothetical protein